jgi:hypothetical protein
MNTQPDALRLAGELEDAGKPTDITDAAAVELRRLHAANQELLEALKEAAWCVQHNHLPDKMGHDWDDIVAKHGEKK